jgi:hypothetical protein
MTAHQMATADRPAGIVDDAELLALGGEFAPLFDRWSRQGLAVQVRAAMVDVSLDTLFFDPDPRLCSFFESLCAFTGVQFPTTA